MWRLLSVRLDFQWVHIVNIKGYFNVHNIITELNSLFMREACTLFNEGGDGVRGPRGPRGPWGPAGSGLVPAD